MNTIDTSDSAGLWIGHDKMFDFLKACASDAFTLSACIHMPLSGAVTQFIHASAEFMSHISISMNNGIRLTQYYFFHASVKFTDSTTNIIFGDVQFYKSTPKFFYDIIFELVKSFSGLVENFSKTGTIGNQIYEDFLSKTNNLLNIMRLILLPSHEKP